MEQPTNDVIRNMHEVLREGRIVGIAVGMLSAIRGTSRSQGYEHLHGLAVDAQVRVIDLAEALVAAPPACGSQARYPLRSLNTVALT